MEKRAPFLRYKLILEKLGNKRRSSGKEILAYLEACDYPISLRGFQRDIDFLSQEYQVSILYERSGNYYYIDSEHSPGLESTMGFLELAANSNLIIESCRDMKSIRQYIAFERAGLGKGMEHIPLLLSALKTSQMMKLEHHTFQDGQARIYELAPQMLKQYQGRWYVVGNVEGVTNPMVFGLDRITHIELLPDRFHKHHQDQDIARYDYIIGVSIGEGYPSKVRFRTTQLQARYLESLPLHHSQKVVSRTERYVEFSLLVIPNYELKQELLRLGDTVKVLEPLSLAQEIREIHENYTKSDLTLT